MKSIITLVALLHTSVSFAGGYICEEIPKVPRALSAKLHTVQVTNMKELSDTYRGKLYDHVMQVNVKIVSDRNGQKVLEKNFNAVSTSEDVIYEISAPKVGVKFGIYLDELDQSWLYLKNAEGKTSKHQLNCEYFGAEKV